MNYNYKEKGFSLIEIIIYITLASIFSTVLFSVIKINEKTNRHLIAQSKTEKNARRILEIIENTIKCSGSTGEYYKEKKYVDHSFFIGNFEELITIDSCADLFYSKSKKGNVLLLEIPKVEGDKAVQHFIVFQFRFRSLLVHEGTISAKRFYLDKKHSILHPVTGSFSETKNGILINFSINNLCNKQQMEFRGYENYKK